MMKKAIICLLGLLSVFSESVLANPQAYRVTVDSWDRVVISGLTPKQRYSMIVSGTWATQTATADQCGLVTIKLPGEFAVTNHNWQGLWLNYQQHSWNGNTPTVDKPICRQTAQGWELIADTWNMNGSLGTVWVKGNTIKIFQENVTEPNKVYPVWLLGDLTPDQSSYLGKPKTINISANSCGIATFDMLSNRGLIYLSNANYQVRNSSNSSVFSFTHAELPSSRLPVCRQGILYQER